MKAKALFCLCCIAAIVGCAKDDTIMLLSMQEQNRSANTRLERNPFDLYKFSDSTIVLGAKLDNPYSVANLQIARDSLIAEGASPSLLPVINVTHYYARFKPYDDDALANLIDRDTTIVYYEFPLDYEIKEYGVSYHDPSIADTLPTYQYASVPIAKWQNLQDIPNVECTLLEPLCILDEDKDGSNLGPITPIDPNPFDPSPRDSLPFKPVNPGDTTKLNSNNGLNRMPSKGDDNESVVSALMSKSFELTGNGDYEEPSMTRASSKWQPAGRITVYDDIAKKQIPLVRAIVHARRWFTIYTGLTDLNGYFKCNGKFKNRANYTIVWRNNGFCIRDGNILQAYYNGPKIKGDWNLDIKDGKSVRYATIHRAAQRLYFGGHGDISTPATHTCIGYHHKKGPALGDYNRGVGCGIWADIRVFGKDGDRWCEMSEIFSTTSHELGHASHYTNAEETYRLSESRHLESWARFVEYYLTKLEYTELGLYDIYSPYIEGTAYREPKDMHNMQTWNRSLLNGSNKKHYSKYTPIYIDLYDDFNQQQYYRSINNPNYFNYPDDDMNIKSVELLQMFVFRATSFSEMRQALNAYIRICFYKPPFDITEENINKLFSYYE